MFVSAIASPAQSQKAIITEAADRYGVRPETLWGLYGTETSFGKAAGGNPFQFEPSTAKSMGLRDVNNFKEAANDAAKYLGEYKSRGLAGMLSAYNAGPAGGLQPTYVKTTEANAKTYGAPPKGVTRNQLPVTSTKTQSLSPITTQRALGLAQLGKLVSSEGSAGKLLLDTGVLSTKAEEPTTPTKLPRAPATQGEPVGRPSGKLGGFLSGSAPLEYKRIDQGQDIQTKPGEGLLAPGDGTVVAVKSDPSGFGPDYPVVKFSSGPMAGQTVYLGHTDTALKAGDGFKAGQTIARTSKSGHNAPPGWAEIGMASALGQGIHNQGAKIAPYLRKG